MHCTDITNQIATPCTVEVTSNRNITVHGCSHIAQPRNLGKVGQQLKRRNDRGRKGIQTKASSTTKVVYSKVAEINFCRVGRSALKPNASNIISSNKWMYSTHFQLLLLVKMGVALAKNKNELLRCII